MLVLMEMLTLMRLGLLVMIADQGNRHVLLSRRLVVLKVLMVVTASISRGRRRQGSRIVENVHPGHAGQLDYGDRRGGSCRRQVLRLLMMLMHRQILRLLTVVDGLRGKHIQHLRLISALKCWGYSNCCSWGHRGRQ